MSLTHAQKIQKFMDACQQPVRVIPTADVPDDELFMRAKLVFEEAVEFVNALGYVLHFDETVPTVKVYPDRMNPVDLVEAADAIADIEYVVLGSAHTLGIPVDLVFDEVHASNMTKIVDGKPEVFYPDGKVGKGASYRAPDVRQVLINNGWES